MSALVLHSRFADFMFREPDHRYGVLFTGRACDFVTVLDLESLMLIEFWGMSDDLVYARTVSGAKEAVKEFYAEDVFEDVSGVKLVVGGELLVMAIYAQSGCWAFSVSQMEEGCPIPPWTIKVDQHPEVAYSARLVIDTGDRKVTVVREK